MSAKEFQHAIVLRSSEISLKGANRRWFEKKLVSNVQNQIRRALGSDVALKISLQHTRIIVEFGKSGESADPSLLPKIREVLQRTFGLANYSVIRKVPTDLTLIAEAAIQEVNSAVEKKTGIASFRIRTRRSDKVLPETSQQIDAQIGSAVRKHHPGLAVTLTRPELSVGIEIRRKTSFLWTEKSPGLRGLPVGTNGHVLSLLSGGIDSPVAAIQILKRGATTSFLHFYGAPFVGPEVLEKVEDLARLINRFQPQPLPLHVIPFGKIQERIALATHSKVRTLLYRRMMIRIANQLAIQTGAYALVTGDSLGQVASQTVENLRVIDSASELPLFRPLLTFDKEEIIERAQKFGTYETSLLPGLDCCTLFADRHPVLRGSVAVLKQQEASLPIEELVQEALAGLEIKNCD